MNTAKYWSTQPSRGEKLASEMELIIKDFNMQMKEENKVRNENILKALIKHDHDQVLDQHKAVIRQTADKHIKFLEKASYERQLQRTTQMEADMKKVEAEMEHLFEIENAMKGKRANK